MKYIVQAILNDGNAERVIDSFKTDDYRDTLEFLMKRHKSSFNYLYVVMDLETQEILVHTTNNTFSL